MRFLLSQARRGIYAKFGVCLCVMHAVRTPRSLSQETNMPTDKPHTTFETGRAFSQMPRPRPAPFRPKQIPDPIPHNLARYWFALKKTRGKGGGGKKEEGKYKCVCVKYRRKRWAAGVKSSETPYALSFPIHTTIPNYDNKVGFSCPAHS